MINLPHRPERRDKAPKIKGDSIEELLVSTSHVIFHIDGKGASPGKLGCARCHSQFNITDPAAKHWLKCPCRELGSARDRSVPIPYEEVHLGNRVTHHTHKLFKLKGLIYTCVAAGVRLS